MFVAPRFDVYRAVSCNRSMRSSRTIRPWSSRSLSLDEAYLDVTDNLSGIRTAWETAKEIRGPHLGGDGAHSLGRSFFKQVPQRSSRPMSASRTASSPSCPTKPRAFVAALPIAKSFMAWARRRQPGCTRLALRQARICGVKPSTSCVRGSAKRAIGTLKLRVAVSDDRPVQYDRERKSSGSETTFSEDLTDRARIEAG